MISCLMVTSSMAPRFEYFKRSLADYCRQTYADKELVVVFCHGEAIARKTYQDYIGGLGRGDIRMVEHPPGATLGALRNFSRAQARGAVIAQWDDDDRFHPERLARQAGRMREEGADAVYLQSCMLYFTAERMMYCTNWIATAQRCMPGTLMCDNALAARYPEGGPEAIKGEDTVFALSLLKTSKVAFVADAPHLFVYNHHGANTWGMGHNRMLAKELGFSRGLLARREAELRRGLAAFDFGPEPVTVQGSNGAAFQL